MKEKAIETRTGKKTIIGILWMFFTAGMGKFASLIAQVVLGWFLTKEDFGLYALALSVSASVSLLRNGGTQQILIQRGPEYAELAPSIFKFSLVFNSIACLLLVMISPIAATVYKAPELQVMLGLIALSIVLMTPYGILRAKLVIDHRFKEISIVGLISNITRQGSTMICAFVGLGYMSFIYPVVLEPIVLFLLSFYFVKEWVRDGSLTIKIFRKIFIDARWVMLGSLALALSTTGQYFIIGLFEDKENLGIYFFGFQLIIVISVIITSVIETVFLPVLASLSTDKEQYKSAYINVLFSICFISLIIGVLIYINTEWLVVSIWKGKWNQAIPIIQTLALTLPAILFTNFNKVVMESKGLWGKRLINLAFFVMGDLLVAGLAAWKNDIYFTAIMVCIYRNVFALAQCLWISEVVRVSIKSILNSIVPNVLLILLLLVSSVLSIEYFDFNDINFFIKQAIISCFIVFLFFVLNFLFENKRVKKFIVLIKR